MTGCWGWGRFIKDIIKVNRNIRMSQISRHPAAKEQYLHVSKSVPTIHNEFKAQKVTTSLNGKGLFVDQEFPPNQYSQVGKSRLAPNDQITQGFLNQVFPAFTYKRPSEIAGG